MNNVIEICSELPQATHTGELSIAGVKLPCHVLRDGRRVLSQRGMVQSLAMSRGGANGGDRLAVFLESNGLRPHVSSELLMAINSPVVFLTKTGGTGFGYEAVTLLDVCHAVMTARREGILHRQQTHIADQCEALIIGFSKVGIIALIDEATGYQDARARDELHRLLELYVAKELLAWSKRFPDEFYKQIFRLFGWPYPPNGSRTPRYVGKITNDIIYARLPRGVLDELRARNPSVEGRRRYKHHQYLTEEIGNAHLSALVQSVTAMMRASNTWSGFRRMLDRAYPIVGAQLDMRLDDELVH